VPRSNQITPSVAAATTASSHHWYSPFIARAGLPLRGPV
jgi:hypothetical protein